MINEILNILYKNKTTNIRIIKKESICFEYIIIATGTSVKHIKNVVKDFTVTIKKEKILSGKNSDWLIINIEEIIIHLMLKETRSFYDLESLYLDNY